MTTSTSTSTSIWAVTCPGDPHEERPTHYIADSEASAIAAYAWDYRENKTVGVDAFEIELSALADEADEACDAAQASDCRLALAGDTAALERVCIALNG